MSLLSEIQAECVSKEASTSRILRLCLQLAVRLKHLPLKEWVLHELNGYPEGISLPSYRVYSVRSMGDFADRLLGQARLDIPVSVLPERARKNYATARLDQPISQYESLLGGGDLKIPWPMELAVRYGSTISSMQCIAAWQELPTAAVVGMIDTVKTKILTMALEIEAEDPTAGDIASSQSSIPDSRVNQIFYTTIHGGQIHNFSAGSTGVSQTVNQVQAGDIKSLTDFLISIGTPASDVESLIEDIRVEKSEGQPGIGPRVAEWLRNRRLEANDIGKQSLAGIAAQAVLAFFGIG